jgi:hypothetical protein
MVTCANFNIDYITHRASQVPSARGFGHTVDNDGSLVYAMIYYHDARHT